MTPYSRRPVIAAIPNYNMGDSLKKLLPQVLAQGYDAVYVLDDRSRDDTQDVVRQFPEVTLIIGDKNVGAGGNRNRILVVADQWHDALIHFIDADIHLDTPHMPQLIRGIFHDPALGVVGGLVREREGRQSVFNYGPRASFESTIGALLQGWQQNAPLQRIRGIRRYFHTMLRHWPDISGVPQPTSAHFVLEGNMCVPMDVLYDIGGFDPNMRFHEAQDLGNKIAARGLQCRFDPSFSVTHLAIKLSGHKRSFHMLKAGLQMLHRNKWPLR